MKWLSKLPSFATLFASRWFIGLAAAGLAGGALWMYGSGKLSGYQSGYERAEQAYRGQVEQAINDTVERRDEQWTADLEEIYNEIEQRLEQNARTIEQERELRSRISNLQEELADSLRELRNTDLGTCNLSPDFDSLFTSPEEAGPTTGTASDNQP